MRIILSVLFSAFAIATYGVISAMDLAFVTM